MLLGIVSLLECVGNSFLGSHSRTLSRHRSIIKYQCRISSSSFFAFPYHSKKSSHSLCLPPPPRTALTIFLALSAVASAASFAAARARAAVVDESAPSTTIQIVLADKSKIRQKFNLTQTVLDIYQHVQLYV